MTEKGEQIVDMATILDEKEGIVEIKFEQVSLNTGISFFELTIMDANHNTKKSPKIAYRVLDSLSEDAIIESERYPILVNMIKDVDELHTTTENLINDTHRLKEQVIELNDTMSQAELVRETNEGVRQQNEASRIENMNRINQEMVDFKEEVNDMILTLPRIEDDKISEVNTFSSKKIQEELDKKSEFDRSYNSLTNLPENYIHPEYHTASMILHSDGTSMEDKLVSILDTISSIMTRLEAIESAQISSEV